MSLKEFPRPYEAQRLQQHPFLGVTIKFNIDTRSYTEHLELKGNWSDWETMHWVRTKQLAKRQIPPRLSWSHTVVSTTAAYIIRYLFIRLFNAIALPCTIRPYPKNTTTKVHRWRLKYVVKTKPVSACVGMYCSVAIVITSYSYSKYWSYLPG